MWERQLHNPNDYRANYPFPSIALDDPKFVRPIPANSWGGASQALTALRTLRWMEYYSKGSDLRVLMERWSEAILRAGSFRQQMDPNSGLFTQPDPDGYSPCALISCILHRGWATRRFRTSPFNEASIAPDPKRVGDTQ